MLEKIRQIEMTQKLKELMIINEAILRDTELLYIKHNNNVINRLTMLNSKKDRLIEEMKKLS